MLRCSGITEFIGVDDSEMIKIIPELARYSDKAR